MKRKVGLIITNSAGSAILQQSPRIGQGITESQHSSSYCTGSLRDKWNPQRKGGLRQVRPLLQQVGTSKPLEWSQHPQSEFISFLLSQLGYLTLTSKPLSALHHHHFPPTLCHTHFHPGPAGYQTTQQDEVENGSSYLDNSMLVA